MTHCIQSVKPMDNCIIEALFFNGEIKHYDVKTLFTVFPEFKVFRSNEDLFQQVVVDKGGYGISWSDELDLDAETIWENGILIETSRKPDLRHLLAYRLIEIRNSANMTQKELSDRIGIYQADISKIERGIGNPSLSTLERIADGLGVELSIDFITKS